MKSTFLQALILSLCLTSVVDAWSGKNQHLDARERFPMRSTSVATRLQVANLGSGVPSPKKKNLKTFQRYLEIECWKQADKRDLERTLQAVADSCKQINRIVQRAQTDDLYGAALDKDGNQLEENVQGEVQQQLDVLCNTIMLRSFCGSSSCINMVASEEEDEPRSCSDVMVRIAVSSLWMLTVAVSP